MSDTANQDESLKTEEPTARRLQEARDKGQVARSQEVSHWFMILAFALIMSLLAPAAARSLLAILKGFIEQPHAIQVDAEGLGDLVGGLMFDIAVILALPMVIIFSAAVMGSFIQIGMVFSIEPLKPKLSKISPWAGLKRLFSSRALVEFAKGIGKLCIVGLVVFLLVWPQRDVIPLVPTLPMIEFLELERGLAVRILFGVVAVMTVLAILDFMYQRLQHHKQLRMTKQEVKDELKQSEGDPMIKARLRQIRMERARRRMMAAVPEADVVVTNPTHYAVAMRYDADTMPAPRVTAKGIDEVARRIRQVAEKSGVPVVENPPLAQALYGSVELEAEIPPEHYKAVAEVIGYVMRLKGRLRPGQAAGRRDSP